jgi:hypothetical protein
MGRPLKIKQSTTVDIGFNPFNLLDQPTVVIPDGMLTTEYLGVVGGGFPSGIATPSYPTVACTAYFTDGAGETAAYIITQKGQTKYLVASNNTVSAGTYTVGQSYVIKSVGNTNWGAIGGSRSNPQVGDVFTATGVGSGTGTASSVAVCSLVNLPSGSLTTSGTMQITINTGGSTVQVSKLTNKFVWDYETPPVRFAANFFVAGGTGTNPLASVAVTGSAGQCSCSSDTLTVGQIVTVTGTLTGTATGIGAGTYYIVATNGSTTFTLSATPGGAGITTTAGTTTGLSFVIAASTTLKSGADPVTWTNGTGILDLAEVTNYTS